MDVSSSDKNVFVEARVLEGKNFKILFGFNRGDKETTAKLTLSVKGQNWTVKNLETKKKITFNYKEGRVVVEKLLKPQQAWVVLIEKK